MPVSVDLEKFNIEIKAVQTAFTSVSAKLLKIHTSEVPEV